jgi:hypothetical protein
MQPMSVAKKVDIGDEPTAEEDPAEASVKVKDKCESVEAEALARPDPTTPLPKGVSLGPAKAVVVAKDGNCTFTLKDKIFKHKYSFSLLPEFTVDMRDNPKKSTGKISVSVEISGGSPAISPIKLERHYDIEQDKANPTGQYDFTGSEAFQCPMGQKFEAQASVEKDKELALGNYKIKYEATVTSNSGEKNADVRVTAKLKIEDSKPALIKSQCM